MLCSPGVTRIRSSRSSRGQPVSGGLAAAGSLGIAYPLDYARKRLAAVVGSERGFFSGLGNGFVKTAEGPGGPLTFYTGSDVPVVGVVGSRGPRLGCLLTVAGLNP